MQMIMTDMFELVDNKDLTTTSSCHHSILRCNKCEHFFFTKACGGRNIFQSDRIYHPADGNCIIAEMEYTQGEDKYAWCDCTHEFEWITTVDRLKQLVHK